jgi:hypothetical protein
MKEKDGDNLAFIVVATLTPKQETNDATIKLEVFDATAPDTALTTAYAGSIRNKGLSRAAKKAFENIEKGASNGKTDS